MNRRHFVAGLAALGPVLAHAAADVVRLFVPVPAGGGPDRVARQFAARMSRLAGAQTIVENKPGATGLVCARAIARAAPDGSTFGFLGVAQATIQAMGAPIDLLNEFKPVGRITISPYVIAVAGGAPFETLGDLIDTARRSPGKLSYGTPGVGSRAHLSVEHLSARVGGLDLIHVAFKGGTESLIAAVGRDVGFAVGLLSTALPMLRAGRVRALAVTTRYRVSLVPDVPTVAESGFPEYEYDTWAGLFAPAKTPDEIVAKTAEVIGRIGADPDFRSFVETQGDQVDVSGSPQQFRKLIARSLAEETALVTKLGLKFN